jgi:hypothetical protein
VLRTSRHEVGSGGHRFTDQIAIDDGAAGLQSGPQKGVRSAADQQTAVRRRPEQALGILPGEGQRLLTVHVLADLQGGAADLGMGRGDGEVEHHLDLRISQQLVDVAGAGYPELSGARLCPLPIQIGARYHAQAREGGAVLQIDGADRTATHHADAHRV